MDPPTATATATPKHPTTYYNYILKGKRTKRPRPITHSPPNSHSPSTTEDEDTANCLILLSKGHNNNIQDSSIHKKHIQTSTHSYVYECKTCNKTFPSFQALGGHTASHKKPKPNQFNQPSELLSSSSQEKFKKPLVSNKQHECSICGAEFNSGQALGGHMRRHRAPNSISNTTLSLVSYGSETLKDDGCYELKLKNDGLGLGLDLNLPAPETYNQDQNRESGGGFKFMENEKKEQSSLGLSAGLKLVDCYY